MTPLVTYIVGFLIFVGFYLYDNTTETDPGRLMPPLGILFFSLVWPFVVFAGLVLALFAQLEYMGKR